MRALTINAIGDGENRFRAKNKSYDAIAESVVWAESPGRRLSAESVVDGIPVFLGRKSVAIKRLGNANKLWPS
jgi:hypothetical protein